MKIMHTLLILVLYSGLFAQDLSIRAFVSNTQVSTESQFQYSVEITGKTTETPKVQYPDFTDFFVLSGPSSSTSIQWINGDMTSKKTYSFYLRPKREGKITIGKASIRIKGKTLETKPVTLSVSDAPAPKPKRKENKQDSEIAGEDLYLKAVVSDRNVFIGEQVTVEYKIYFRMNIRGYDFEKRPSNPGFWSEEFEMPRQPVVNQEVINGVNYNVATLKKYALFPTQTGNLSIEPMGILVEAEVRNRRRRSVFDEFFDRPFGSTVQKKVESKPVSINVNALPERNQPADFNGAVGRYSFNVSTDKINAEVNEAIALKIHVKGSGNIKIVDLPVPAIPPDIEQYDPKMSSDLNNSGNLIQGSKSAEYILIPRLPGEYTIKPITFSYFDPVAKSYKNERSQAIDITVTGEAKPVAGGGQVAYSRKEVALLGQDIRFIKEQTHFVRQGNKPYMGFGFWASLLSGLILFTVFIFYNDYQARVLENDQLSRSKKAGKMAMKRLKDARRALNSNAPTSTFYKVVNLALQGFIRDKLNLDLSDFTNERARELLTKKGIDQTLIDSYIRSLEENDFRQYANISVSEEDKKSAFEQARKILTQLEKWI